MVGNEIPNVMDSYTDSYVTFLRNLGFQAERGYNFKIRLIY